MNDSFPPPTKLYYVAWLLTVPALSVLFYFRYVLTNTSLRCIFNIPFRAPFASLSLAFILFVIDNIIRARRHKGRRL